MTDGLNNSTLQSSIDFAGMGSLRGQAQQKTEKATRETATQFEALFIHEMLKTMRQTIEKSDLNGSDAEDTFQEMYDRELSQQLAKRNTLGVADMLVKASRSRQCTATDIRCKGAADAAQSGTRGHGRATHTAIIAAGASR
jgi:peptidoglycan hydrolase FlgJ